MCVCVRVWCGCNNGVCVCSLVMRLTVEGFAITVALLGYFCIFFLFIQFFMSFSSSS